MPRLRINSLKQQQDEWTSNPDVNPKTIVERFLLHYPNIRSFAAQISRFKSKLKTAGCTDKDFLSKLKTTPAESKEVQRLNKKRLEQRCKDESITLKGVGDLLILLFRKWLNSDTLGELYCGYCCIDWTTYD